MQEPEAQTGTRRKGSEQRIKSRNRGIGAGSPRGQFPTIERPSNGISIVGNRRRSLLPPCSPTIAATMQQQSCSATVTTLCVI